MNRQSIEQVTFAVMRVAVGLFFLAHGAQKLFGWFGGFGQPGGTAAIGSMMGVAGILEFFGGIAIMVGLFTTPIAFILSGEMAVAYFMAHLPNGIWPIANRGEAAALYAFVFLYISAHGAGPYSLDAALFRKRQPVGETARQPHERYASTR